MKLLALDAATEQCSVALWLDGRLLDRVLRSADGHGSLLLPAISELLLQAHTSLAELDAIAFGRGPGAFTGVRLAASVAQGLAFAAGLPVLPISDLRALAAQALWLPDSPPRVLVCQDARMQEVYWGWFEILAAVAQPRSGERVSPPATLLALCAAEELGDSAGAGSGFAAYPQLQALFRAAPERLWPQLYPRAREIAQLAAHQGLAAAVSAEQAQPVYVRDQVASVPGALT